MTADSVPAPMVQLPAETVEKLREAYNHRTAFAANVIAAARAVLDAATPAASVPAPDILALAEKWQDGGRDKAPVRFFVADLRALVAAAEQADKGEAADTPRTSHMKANVEGCPTCRNVREFEAARVPVNDEAEAAWQAWEGMAKPVGDSVTYIAKVAFIAGFRAARGEDA